MENIERIKKGIAAFIDKEMFPVMPKTRGILFSAFAPVYIETKSKEILQNPTIKEMGFVENDGVDVDKVYRLIKEKASGHWPLEVAGFKFSESDFDKLYRYIKEG